MQVLEALRAILAQEKLTILFQPIVATGDGRIHGYEALTRGPSDTPLHAPMSLFDAAFRHGVLLDLESACWRIAYRQFKALALPGKLFLNTSPLSLCNGGSRMGDALVSLGCGPGEVVIEITEQYPIDDFEAVREAALRYKGCGFEIAIDDLGAGYSGLRLWSELRPDYVKIDAHFMQDLHHDPVKQEFVRSIQDIALGTGCRVIAEGIETAGEHRIVSKLGIPFSQGYHFARPAAQPPTFLAPDVEQRVVSEPVSSRFGTIGSLAVDISPVPPDADVESVGDLFAADPELSSVPVVVEGFPIGMVRRATIVNLFASRFGRDLHARKRIERFMDREPFIVEHDLPLEKTSLRITGQYQSGFEHDFVITREGRYLGMGRVRDLLKKITELQVHNARHANPLTLLPGNVRIGEEIAALLKEGAEFTLCYADIDHFKPFNDHHGYQQGDEVIRKLAQILVAHADPVSDFVGHIGGDDFIVLFRSEDWQRRCDDILRHFDRDARAFLRMNGKEEKVGPLQGQVMETPPLPMLTLSLAAVMPDPALCRSHQQVAALAAAAKREAKKRHGNCLFIDRRRGPVHPLHVVEPIEEDESELFRVSCF